MEDFAAEQYQKRIAKVNSKRFDKKERERYEREKQIDLKGHFKFGEEVVEDNSMPDSSNLSDEPVEFAFDQEL